MIKRLLYSFVFIVITIVQRAVTETQITSAITYELNGGRFGDNLLSYCRTKWLGYKNNVPLLYVPFAYSDQLMMHEKEPWYDPEECIKQFESTLYLLKKEAVDIMYNSNLLYFKKWKYEVHINWQDKQFVEELRTLITPRFSLRLLELPKDCVTVAVHIRRGGGYCVDTSYLMRKQILRFASDEYYIEQIKRIAQIFAGEKLYVHIFTDDRNPEIIAQNYKQAVGIDTIEYGYRAEKNNHHSNVLEDFFSMMKFDCLIRPKSHYSRFVERLGYNKVIIAPAEIKNAYFQKTIDMVKIRIKEKTGWSVTRENMQINKGVDNGE